MDSIFIARRFCGPPDSGNGGYTCGLVAQAMHVPADVTIRRPIPMEKELSVHEVGDGVQLKNGEELIAEGAPLLWSAHPPKEQITFAEAEASTAASPAFHDHPF